VQIRVVGTPEEAESAVGLIGMVVTVVEDSGPRPRRGGGLQVSRYLDVRLPPSGPAKVSSGGAAPRRPGRRAGGGETAGGDAVDLSAWS
jgi:hypothetical protein